MRRARLVPHALTALAVATIMHAAPACAAPGRAIGILGWGPQFGITGNPDQFRVGAHLEIGDALSHVFFRPDLELGVGDGLTLASVDYEVAWRFTPEGRAAWTPYLGGGAGANFMNWDETRPAQERTLGDGSSSDVGLNVVAGIDRRISAASRFLTELRLGLSGEPDFKLTLGWTFY